MPRPPPDQERSSVSRRTILAAGIAGAFGCGLPRLGSADSASLVPAIAANRQFSVLYKGNRIGAHSILYSVETGITRVTTEINLLVKLGIFTLFRFVHNSTETWRGGKLTSLRSRTLEHGQTLRITGEATPLGFRVVSKGGPFIAASATLTSNSLWTPTVLAQETVVDAQHGGIIGVSARKIGDEQIVVADRHIHATRYTLITPYLAGTIWYDADDLWVGAEFERDGSKIQYRLDT